METVTRRQRLTGQAVLVVVVIVLWEAAPLIFDLNPLVLPRFSDVLAAFGRPLTGGGTIRQHTVVTLQEVGGAFAVAAVAAIVVGVPIGLMPRVREVSLYLLTAAFAVPIMVMIPLFLVTLGLGIESKVAFGALYAFFPIVFNVVAGTSNVDQVHLDVARAFGLPPAQRIRKVVLRSAARSTLNGLQIGLAIAIIAVMSIEMFGAVSGLGYLIHRAGQRMRIDEVYSLILVTLAMAYALISLLKLVGRLFDVKLEIAAG